MLLAERSLVPLLLFIVNRFVGTCANPIETVSKDVCVIGGGSGGTYTAIALQKAGKSVALIERNDRLGGNVNTYVDPVTKQTYDNGVIVFDPIDVVTDYFKYLDVALAPLPYSNTTTLYVDFATGRPVPAKDLASGNLTAALQSYRAILSKYSYLTYGYDLPSPTPADFLLTWGEFIKKYDLGALAFTTYSYNQGVGNILDVPTLYMLKYLNIREVDALETGDYLTTKAGNNQLLYDSALKKLGSNAFLDSNVTKVSRSSQGVEVLINSPHGQKRITAKKLVLAIRPQLAAVKPFLDLSPVESQLFGQFQTKRYWCGIVNNTGIPDNTSVAGADSAAPYAIPALPGLYGCEPTGITGLHAVYYSQSAAASNAEVQANILTSIASARKALGFAAPSNKPEFVYFHDHQPFFLTVPTDAIKSGFYQKLEALQGQNNTWYTGAAWQTEDSSWIWKYTEHSTLPDLLKSLSS